MIRTLLVLFLMMLVSMPKAFGSPPLGLLEGYQLARQTDHQLRAAQSQTQSVQENEAQARARLLPQVSLSSTRYKVWQQQDSNGISLPRQDYLSESDSLGLRQALYQPRLTAALTQARLAGQGAKADYVDQEQALADRYLGGYLNLLLTE
ncbi:MAG: hypothetical protein RJA77_440, partial [Pseudomonadota bacterium]